MSKIVRNIQCLLRILYILQRNAGYIRKYVFSHKIGAAFGVIFLIFILHHIFVCQRQSETTEKCKSLTISGIFLVPLTGLNSFPFGFICFVWLDENWTPNFNFSTSMLYSVCTSFFLKIHRRWRSPIKSKWLWKNGCLKIKFYSIVYIWIISEWFADFKYIVHENCLISEWWVIEFVTSCQIDRLKRRHFGVVLVLCFASTWFDKKFHHCLESFKKPPKPIDNFG